MSVRASRLRLWIAGVVVVTLVATGFQVITSFGASAAAPVTLKLRVLLIGGGSADTTTVAWQSLLTSEGVAYDTATVSGSSVTLPTLFSDTTGNYNGVIFADSPTAITPSILAPLYSYESTFGVRQIDGYMFPSTALGVNAPATFSALGGTTGTLTSAGLAALPSLKGPIPFDTGSVGYLATAVAGAPYTPWLTSGSSDLAGVYVHSVGDQQAGVSELSLYFNYNSTQEQWLLLGPALIDWLTQGAHLGLYRNYFGQDIDDVFIADNEWSSTYQCTPGATEPPDYTCPAGVANNPADTPPDVLMSAADVAYVVNWQAQTGIRLNLAFNAVGACTAPSVAAESSANCTGSVTDNGVTYTDPGFATDDPTQPDNAGLVNALLANKASFYWMSHTWSHQFLGCNVWQPQALTSTVAQPTGGTFTAGGYTYIVSAATAYGESEPSLPQNVTVAANGSVKLTWPEATNGVSADGATAGPTLAQEAASHTGGDNFWGYNIYRATGGGTYGLVGQVAELPSATAATTYSFTDTGVAPGIAPGSSDGFPSATNPGIDCAPGTGSWEAATSGADDSSIATEIALDQAFAANNGLTGSLYDPSVIVTGEHSGIENPNFGAGLAAAGITVFASDASRQPQAQTIGPAVAAPRYPSNIYYNASNWTDELNEYNTLYVKQGVSIGGTAVGHCTDTNATTCIDAPATEATLLASESHIMLSHVLSNNPRVGYAHQPNLIGPAQTNGVDSGYILLDLIDNMLAQYNTWYTAAAPITQTTDPIQAKILGQQASWSAANTANSVSASITNGVVTVTNGSTGSLEVPLTAPAGTTVAGAAYGSAYGGTLSAWNTLAPAASITLTEVVAPAFTSAATGVSIVGSPFNFTVATSGAPAPTVTESGALPAGLTFTPNTDGTAAISGTAAAGTGGSYPITLTATSTNGTATQNFVLTNSEAPTITSPSTALFAVGVAATYTVTTTGYPAATITETGALPAGLTFTVPDPATGSATIAGSTTAAPGTYPITLQATNVSGSVVTLGLTITVQAAAAPAFTGLSTVQFNANLAGSVALTASGAPTPTITQTGGTLPAGLTFGVSANGSVLISGTPTVAGSYPITVLATNGLAPDATETYTIDVLSTTAILNGTVTAASTGLALPNICAYAYVSTGATTPAYTACANSAGVYQLTGVAPGTYDIEFADPAGGYVPQWFSGSAGGAPNQTGAYVITTSAGAVFDHVDAAMTAGAAPVVSGLSSATSAQVGGGTPVTITGTGFSTTAGATSVRFGTVASTSVTCANTTSCVATVPPAASAGVVDVTVVVATISSPTSAADQFTYYVSGLLRVTTSPAVPSQISVDGSPADTWGLTWLEIAPGTHTVCFSQVAGFTAPGCQAVTVNSAETTTVTGSFVQRGYLQVQTSPAVPSQITIDGTPRDDWGVYTDFAPGSHTVCFGAVAGFAVPGCQSVNVTAGQTATVTGTFTASAGAPGLTGVGLLRVTTSPAVPSQISVDGVAADTWGLTWLEIAPGSHIVCFSDVAGFSTPACQSVTVTADQTSVVTGTFDQRGYLIVTTSPATPGAIIVDGRPSNDWGVYTDLAVGSHQVCFGGVAGYATTPACQTVAVVAGQSSAIVGNYGS